MLYFVVRHPFQAGDMYTVDKPLPRPYDQRESPKKIATDETFCSDFSACGMLHKKNVFTENVLNM